MADKVYDIEVQDLDGKTQTIPLSFDHMPSQEEAHKAALDHINLRQQQQAPKKPPRKDSLKGPDVGTPTGDKIANEGFWKSAWNNVNPMPLVEGLQEDPVGTIKGLPGAAVEAMGDPMLKLGAGNIAGAAGDVAGMYGGAKLMSKITPKNIQRGGRAVMGAAGEATSLRGGIHAGVGALLNQMTGLPYHNILALGTGLKMLPDMIRAGASEFARPTTWPGSWLPGSSAPTPPGAGIMEQMRSDVPQPSHPLQPGGYPMPGPQMPSVTPGPAGVAPGPQGMLPPPGAGMPMGAVAPKQIEAPFQADPNAFRSQQLQLPAPGQTAPISQGAIPMPGNVPPGPSPYGPFSADALPQQTPAASNPVNMGPFNVLDTLREVHGEPVPQGKPVIPAEVSGEKPPGKAPKTTPKTPKKKADVKPAQATQPKETTSEHVPESKTPQASNPEQKTPDPESPPDKKVLNMSFVQEHANDLGIPYADAVKILQNEGYKIISNFDTQKYGLRGYTPGP